MTDDARPVGLILAGGGASRMGGGDKPLRLLAGRPLLAHVAARLRPQCRALLLGVGPHAPARFPGWEAQSVPDQAADQGAGPLAGVLAGLDHLATRGEGAGLLTVPGDTPFVPADLAERLAAAARRADGAPVAFARSGGRDHPLVALWPASVAPALRFALRRRGERRVLAFLAAAGGVAVEWPAMPCDPFFNINTPADLAAAERLLSHGG